MNKNRKILLLIFSLFLSNTIYADIVKFKTGEELWGIIIHESDDEIKIQTGEYSQNKTIKKEDISYYSIRNADVALKNGRIMSGKIFENTDDYIRLMMKTNIVIKLKHTDIAEIKYTEIKPPEPEPSAEKSIVSLMGKGLEIVNFTMNPIEKRYSNVDFEWVVTIRNYDEQRNEFAIHIEFWDENNFKLDKSIYENVFIEANTERTFTKKVVLEKTFIERIQNTTVSLH